MLSSKVVRTILGVIARKKGRQLKRGVIAGKYSRPCNLISKLGLF